MNNYSLSLLDCGIVKVTINQFHDGQNLNTFFTQIYVTIEKKRPSKIMPRDGNSVIILPLL